jgi:hypothetical protein
MPVTAHLVAEYSDPGSARRPATELVRTKWPRASFTAGSAARIVRAAPYTLVSTIDRQNSGDFFPLGHVTADGQLALVAAELAGQLGQPID